MKTAGTNLSKIIRISILAFTVLGFTPTMAGNTEIPAPDSSYYEPLAWAPVYTCRDYTNPPSVLSMDPMYEDPHYWVNYLYCTISTDSEEENPECSICEMENNPDYWIDYLKATIRDE